MASDLSSGCTETIDILDDEKEEGEISLEDVSSSEEGGMGHLTSNYVVGRMRACPDCKSWGDCATWCNATYHPKNQSRRDPVKGKENRHHVRETGFAATKHAASKLQEKNDDLVPISSDSDMEIVGLTDTSNRSKAKVKKKKRKKKEYEPLTIDELISPTSIDMLSSIAEGGSVKIYREVSPTHRSSGRSKMISKSPVRRYRSPVIARSSFQSSRSPLNHSRSPILKKSLRKVRSPKRSLRRHSPVKAAKRLPSKLSSPPSTRSHIDRHGEVTRLLKKVKHLDSIGTQASKPSVNRSKESSSLKEKLSNMNILNRASSDDHVHLKGKSKVESETVDDADDEDDLALLRQKALETKQKKSSRSEHSADVESEKRLAVNNDDQDEEALQLRMIALRSAVMKKHQNRVQRGIKTKRPTRSESPFSSSFLDDIPVPSDELLKYASPPCTPSPESNHIEDMDLDTDIEREKEKLPYSPTDKITENVPIDTALLGIEPSDVSFINVNENIGSPVFDDAQDELATNNVTSYYNETYLPYQALPSKPQFYTHSPSQYNNEPFHSDLNDVTGKGFENSHGNGAICDLIDGICCQEGTYSLTTMSDTHDLPVSKDLLTPPVSSYGTFASSLQMQQIVEQPAKDSIVFVNVDSTFRNDKPAYEMQTIPPFNSVANAPTTAYTARYTESMSPNESIITIDDLPEASVDPLNSPICDDKNLPAMEYIPMEATPCQVAVEKTLQEPLYMQGIPEVTKDMNKIPTLINRKLVPAPILKSNKRLRQHLKKRETLQPEPEPTFKNAEMQPVTVVAGDANSSIFKPIKLQVIKKSAPALSTLPTFDNSVNESLDTSEDQRSSSKEDHEIVELEQTDVATTSSVNETTLARRKRRKKEKRKRKNTRWMKWFENETNPCLDADINRDAIMNASTLDHIATESDQSKSNDNASTHKILIENGELTRLQSITDTQESISSGDVMTEKRDLENHTILLTSIEYSQEEHIKSHCLSTNPAPDNSNSGTVNKATDTTKSVSRRQSIDEDEDELRAILLASLKRTKSADINSPPIAPAIPVTNSVVTNVQTFTLNQTLTDTMLSTVNTMCTPLSETIKKKINDASISVQNGSRKRSTSLDTVKSPPKKITRKTITSTKVVNNAKKYQNMIVKRRLNLRKIDNNAKPSENAWSNANASKISLHASDTQRFVISLGSDTDTESEGEKNESVSVAEKHQAHQEIPTDFEKNLSKFLREVRNEQEQSAAAAAKSSSSSTQATKRDVSQTANGSSNMHTPLIRNSKIYYTEEELIAGTFLICSAGFPTLLQAVRHLPASQQEEYRRLKQEILEREKLKLQRKVASNNSSSSSSNSSNKLSNTNVASSPIKSLSLCEKKAQVKQNQDNLKTLEKNPPQESSTEVGKKSDDVTRDTSELNVCHKSVEKKLSVNIAKHTNSTQSFLQTKNSKKAIPNNLSIRITNVTASSHANGRTVENLCEKQPVTDTQQHKSALRTLSTDEINCKYVQVMLKPNAIERVVTINDKSILQNDMTIGIGQSENPIEPDVNTKNLVEKNLNDVDSNSSTFSTASTVKLSNSSSVSSEHEETMETTMSLSQYKAECQQEINRDTSTSVLADNNNSNNGSHKSDSVANDNSTANDIWDTLKKDVKTKVDSLTSLPEAEQERHLRETEHKLVEKRYTILDHLAEMSGNLRQWDLEKEVQTTLANEVKKLKEQLKIAEERLQQQRDRVNSMGPKVSTARQKINTGRRECFKLSRICSTLGNRLMGKNYKLPEAVDQLLSDKLKEVANHTRQFTKKKRLQTNDISENSYSSTLKETSESSKDICIEENLSQEQPMNDEVVIVETGPRKVTCLTQSNQNKNLLTEISLDFSQVIPRQSIPERGEKTSANALNHCNKEQVTTLNQDNASSSESKLYQNSSTEQNIEHTKESRTDKSDPAVSLELKSSATASSSSEQNEQTNEKASPQLPSPSPTTITMTTNTTTIYTTTTTKQIAPYVSILSHLKKPRNINPHGILCPYEMMGICRDEDCQYIHQSRNQT
ncbi:hypothetical protein ALC57_12444 [Trachymyrmex cornetzi]|uniref:Zinc-finger domain-containing protein n=1 Tax=Trachymyrmex cornetzi TaxID=471704 RepID=A0A195DR56_9HYME|nr:hypothetical protein ALC57_12444 [Trachymyrmex cornetzi]